MPWPHQKPTKIESSLQMENKQIQREHKKKENFWKTCIELLKFRQKNSSKSRSRLLRIYSLQCLTQNSLNRRVRQPLCDPCNLRKMDKWENQSLDDLLDIGPRPWGCFMRCHWSASHTHSITNLKQLFFMFTSLEQFRNYFHGSTKSILLKWSVRPLSW